MPIPLLIMSAGTALQVAGNLSANQAQASAGYRNAEFIKKQRQLMATRLRANLMAAEQQFQYKQGQATSIAARGGADVGSGSIMIQTANLAATHIRELADIRTTGMLEIEAAGLQADQARRTADILSSPGYNLLQAGTTVLQNFNKADTGVYSQEIDTTASDNAISNILSGAYKGAGTSNSYLTGSSGGYSENF